MQAFLGNPEEKAIVSEEGLFLFRKKVESFCQSGLRLGKCGVYNGDESWSEREKFELEEEDKIKKAQAIADSIGCTLRVRRYEQ